MSLTSKLILSSAVNLVEALDLGERTAKVSKKYTSSLANGTGVGLADKLFQDTRTLAASATEDLDLAGVLLDPFGAAITFARIKGIIVAAAPGNTNNVLVGAASATQWATLLNAAGVVTLRPGAVFAAFAGDADATGYTVTAGTGDLLKVANSAGGTSVSYDIVLIGASA